MLVGFSKKALASCPGKNRFSETVEMEIRSLWYKGVKGRETQQQVQF